LAPEENELQMERAVDELGFRITPLPESVRDAKLNGNPLAPGLATLMGRTLPDGIQHTRHALPHLHASLGFYLARLVKEDA
jgi:16S rRNA C967 or C1407 C5-methylase (RsmB/RsmF family)